MSTRIYLIVAVGIFLQSTPTAPASKELADEIVVVKSEHNMTLLNHGRVLHTYQVALSTVSVGAKQRNGDHKVPEGEYRIDFKNPTSKFHLALRRMRKAWALILVVTLRFTGWPSSMRSWEPCTDNMIGPMDASQ